MNSYINNFFSIEVTVFGIEIDIDDEHPLKTCFTIEVTIFGIEMDVNGEHIL
jgi:hypothetical protein